MSWADSELAVKALAVVAVGNVFVDRVEQRETLRFVGHARLAFTCFLLNAAQTAAASDRLIPGSKTLIVTTDWPEPLLRCSAVLTN
jgi:hypothetical protein